MKIDPRFIWHRAKIRKKDPPNSLKTLRKSQGVAVESDVMLLKDGKLVVIHPKDVQASDAEVERMVFLELVERKRQQGIEAQVPLFRDWVIEGRARDLYLVLEIKASSPQMARLAGRAAVEELWRMKYEGVLGVRSFWLQNNVLISSFHIEALEEARDVMRSLKINIPLGLLWASSPERADPTLLHRLGTFPRKEWETHGIKMAKNLGCKVINFIPSTKITKSLIAQAHQKGLKVYVGVINDFGEAKRFLHTGVDKIVFEQ